MNFNPIRNENNKRIETEQTIRKIMAHKVTSLCSASRAAVSFV
jgi:hypothetical protein